MATKKTTTKAGSSPVVSKAWHVKNGIRYASTKNGETCDATLGDVVDDLSKADAEKFFKLGCIEANVAAG